jgi:DMSO reductase anchor subunit
MTFDQQWDAATYNSWYWVSYSFMLVVPIVGTAVVAFCCRRRWVRRTGYSLVAIGCLAATTETTILSIMQKWETRRAAAVTMQDNYAVASRDGANMAFSPVIGFASGLVAIPLVMITAAVTRRMLPRASSPHALEGSSHDPQWMAKL